MSSDSAHSPRTKIHPDPHAQGKSTARLMVVEGEASTRAREIVDQKTTFGRASDNDLVLRSEYISKYHGHVLREGEQFFVEDLGSKGGIVINGLRLEPGKKHLLSHGDTLRVVEHVLLFCHSGSFMDRRGLSTIHFDKKKVQEEVDSFLARLPIQTPGASRKPPPS